MSLTLLELKLKRHQITFSNENGKIIIGKAKTDLLKFIGVVIIPIIAASAIGIFYLISNTELMFNAKAAVIGGTLILFSSGLFNYSRIKAKQSNNKDLKIIQTNSITLKNEYGEYIFNSGNTKKLYYTIDEISEDTYEANLFLIDNKDRQHLIIGFDEENEKYATNDLKWFADYLKKELKI